MSLFEFCLEIIRREGKRFNVGVNGATASQITAATASDVNFDVAHNRCSYLYRCGAINLSFARDCFKKFLSDEKNNFLSKLKESQNTICSISKGPALDYIAFLLSYQECNVLPPLFKNIKVLSKYGAWRNTVNIMLEVMNNAYLKCLSPFISIGDVEVIQGDPFAEFTDKVKQPISDSDVILMVKTLNLKADGYDQIKIANGLQNFLGALKPGAIIFCIDTKPSIAAITHQLCSFLGNFLYEPTFMNTMINLEHADFYKDIFGCFPVASARGSFFVWQKVSIPSPNLDLCFLDGIEESFKNQLQVNDNEDNVHFSKLSEDNLYPSFENSYNKQIASAPANFCDPNISKNLKTNGSDRHFGHSDIVQNSEYLPARSPLQDMPAHDFIKKENNGLFKKTLNSSALVNQAVQTDLEDLERNNFIKLTDLSNKIAKLTTTLGEMLQTSELENRYKNDSSLRGEGTECKHAVSSDCTHNHFSSITPCTQCCTCKNILKSVKNCCITCACCQKRVFESSCQTRLHIQEQFRPNLCNSNTSLNDDFEASKHDISCNSRLKLAMENNPVSMPKLVIPLNNLSGTTVSQILTIIAQSNQEQ